MKVQLLSFPGCPNADAAREALRRSLAVAGLPASFEEIDARVRARGRSNVKRETIVRILRETRGD